MARIVDSHDTKILNDGLNDGLDNNAGIVLLVGQLSHDLETTAGRLFGES